uniref:Major facilitator superfamily (MFS) profile domain-containing protein n=1 Tax=Lotharella globosa TaxID=91324 RepID=A0A6U3BRF1_9EUKA|mmetsp:Transcript_32699/g.63796  ORF Transcript_32699/g.63796 Transcript_32699/m.63796 type:complete len:560 (+) Transcript_32699:98-1777(+)|eukprot:CAMPEP_0167786036 /NCGR_PEP_ID=MMETSP0111_2-20121227/8557_1 /TAXON_ID=91324 /ORGANISM="Lotharella globosa, Strain CCCM811" /LENGTH=559 /DNA_ID=CAMNT_0007677349 /DNA_START=98 /DNA_END=1777 /DNA_ORIENTATION=+
MESRQTKAIESVKTARDDEDYFRYRQWLVLLALLQSFLAAGIFYGWPSLYTMLLEEGIYNNRCPHPGVVCARQTLDLGFIYTVGGCANLGAQLLWGFILDRKGPRVCSFLSVAMVFAGVILLGITDNEFDVLLYAMICIAVGGPGASVACFHLSNLYPESKNTVLSLFSGAFQLGFMVFMIFHMISPSLLSRFQVCMVYATLLFIVLITGLAVWPEHSLTAPRDEEADDPIRQKKIDKKTLESSPSFMRINQYADPSARSIGAFGSGPSLGGVPSAQEITSGSPSRSGSLVESPGDYKGDGFQLYRVDSDILRMASIATPTVRRQVKRQRPSLMKELMSFPFFMMALWMSAGLFWMNFYIGNVADQMFQQADGNRHNAHLYTSYFTTILPLGAAAIPIYGWTTDNYGLPCAVIVSTLFGIAFTVMCLIHDLELQVLTFIAYSLFRTFVFATFFSLVAKEFGYSSFGVISGLILCIAGGICLFQYPVREFAVPDEDFKLVNWIQLLLVNAVGIFFSVYITIHLKDSTPAAKKRKQIKLRAQKTKTYGSTDNKNPVATTST